MKTMLLAITLVLGLAAPALAEEKYYYWPSNYTKPADPAWPGSDPTWTSAHPSWLQQNWQWTTGAGTTWKPPVAPAAVPTEMDMQTALSACAARGDVAMVKALVEHGANVNLRDQWGYTALAWASQRGRVAVVDYLLKHWAQPNPADREGYTPLMWAAQEGQLDTVKLLLAHGANPFVADRRGFDAMGLARLSGNAGVVSVVQNAMLSSPSAKRTLPTPP
ncbi:MAG: cdkn2b [Cyanobacteria bacterium RYN_339]|nr:cdkn2b [Cyanobacteria bacterium RYN_339]